MTDITEAIPVCDLNDPASVEAFYGVFGYAEHFRKVILSNCKELIRAKATEKLTESRIEDLSRVHPLYVQYLIDSLNGRRVREQLIREQIGV